MKLAMQLKDPIEGFPAAVPWWSTRVFRRAALIDGSGLVLVMVLLPWFFNMTNHEFWREPFGILLAELGALAGLLHAWIQGEQQSDDDHEALCAEWYMQRPQKLLEGIDGQVFQNRLVSAADLRVLHLQHPPSRLIVYCKSGDRVLAMHFCNFTSNPYLRNLQEINEASGKAYFLQHNREVYHQSLYGAPEHW